MTPVLLEGHFSYALKKKTIAVLVFLDYPILIVYQNGLKSHPASLFHLLATYIASRWENFE